MNAKRDPWGLLETRPAPRVRFGFTDTPLALRGGSISTGLDQIEGATLNLNPRLLPADPVDYVAPLEVRSARDEHRVLFSGHVADATEGERGLIDISAFGASGLTERIVGTFAQGGLSAPESTYLIARAAGLRDNQLVIEGLDEIEVEVFEVVAPIHGVSVEGPTKLGSVTVFPPDLVLSTIEALGFEPERDLTEGSAFALSLQTDRLGYLAERQGLRDIDVALGWLTTRLRYGLALLPDGSPQHYRRESARALPRRGELVWVRGLASGRRWLRSADLEVRAAEYDLAADDPLLEQDLEPLASADRLAVQACRRAAAEGEPIARLQAIWEAVEFMVAKVRAPRRFADGDIKAIKRSLPRELPEDLRRRAQQAISDLNQVPLMARLRELVEEQGLPCSEAELDLLAELRRTRNDAAHGRAAEPPDADVIDQAVAVVSRLMITKLWRLRAAGDAA